MAELVELVTSDPVVSSVSSFSTNRILQLKQLLEFVSSKDQFKWKGNAEELAELISLILETDERPQLSEDPAHNLLSFKILNIIVKWWKKTLTIAIQGKEHRMFKDKLVDLLKLKSSSDANRLTIAEENGGNMGQVRSDTESSAIFNGISPLLTDQTPEGHISKCSGCSVLEVEFRKLKSDMVRIQELLNEPKNNMQMSAEVNNVAEIERLKELLQEQKAENSVLKGKVAQLQNERDSLTTVIRILNEESNKSEEELSFPTKSACKSASSSPETGHDNGPFKKVEKKKKKQKDQSKTAQSPRKGISQKKTKISILGDSMIKDLIGSKMSSSRSVSVKSFSGAKTSDMKHYIVPTLSTPPDEIVLHIGTNDIIHSSAQQIIQNISEIGDIISEASSETKVTISNIITRSDNVNLHQKIDECNAEIASLVSQKGWSLIDNSNLDSTCLNGSGLHLNNKGIFCLASNIIKHIRSKSGN